MREFFFETCLVIEEKNLVRIRLPASTKDRVRLAIGGDELESEYGADASVLIAVNAPGGAPDPFPFDAEMDETYDPYVEFFFVGACQMAKSQIDGKVGLLVKSDGDMSLHDPTGAFPFGLGQLVEAGRIDLVASDDGDPVSGPHSPKREMRA